MQFAIGGQRPHIDPGAVIAPTAVVSGDVTIEPGAVVSFGATIIGDDGPVHIGRSTIVREHVVIRGATRHPVRIGAHVLIGAHSALYGCTVEDEALLATGVTIFHGARIGTRAEVRIRGVVHVNSALPADAVLPIGWIAVGNPARHFPPSAHDEIWAIQRSLDFPGTVYGVDRRADGSVDMRVVTERAIATARRGRWTPADE
jgi:carbonic anhydrase/acetyltransferase-like protein (isoleucine patch superfamily)